MKVPNKFGFQRKVMPLGTIPFSSGSRAELNLAGGIPKDYYVLGFIAKLKFRFTVSGGTTNGNFAAEFPHNLVERFEISGNHKVWGDWTRLLQKGTHVYNFNNFRDGVPSYANLGGATQGAAETAATSYDCEVIYNISLVPQDVRAEEQFLYLLDTPNWTTCQLYVDWGTALNPVIGGDRTHALSAFGSGAGSPTLEITRVVAMLSDARKGFQTIPVKQSYQKVDLSNTAVDSLIKAVNVGNFIHSIGLVTGTKTVGGSIGAKADNMASLSDAIINKLSLRRDDIKQRESQWRELKSLQQQYSQNTAILPVGYNILNFVEDETIFTAYDTRGIAKDNLRFELYGDVAGAANQVGELIYTEIAGLPVFN